MKEHANTATAVGLTGLSALLVWLFGVVDGELPTAVAATIAGLLVAIGLGIKTRGVKGLIAMLWRGDKPEEPTPSPPPPPPPASRTSSRRKR